MMKKKPSGSTLRHQSWRIAHHSTEPTPKINRVEVLALSYKDFPNSQ